MQRHKTLFAIAAGALLTATAGAQEVDPYAKPDDSWISISGTVVAPDADSFSLDYGEGVILVEMDDWDTYGDAYGLMDGDRVTVYGRVDDDLFEADSIEAGSVYVENLNTYFYASAADEENGDYTPYFWTVTTPLELSRATIRGTVTEIDRPEREFVIDTGNQRMTVETEFLGYNPLDDLGYQKIDEGDRVSVSGVFDTDFLEGRVFEADSVITLSDASRDQR
jgi:uncharacterized protein YdeI (BOF family)